MKIVNGRISQARLVSVEADAHPFCYVCSSANPMGLAVQYSMEADGSVTAHLPGNRDLEGYPGLLHGGVIASLLDGAMTHCMFARGLQALTVELNVRYIASVVTLHEVSVQARFDRSVHGLHMLSGELVQFGTVKAKARGKFMVRNAKRTVA